jgi:hypothetical protein
MSYGSVLSEGFESGKNGLSTVSKKLEENGLYRPPCFEDDNSYLHYSNLSRMSNERFVNFFYCRDCTEDYRLKMVSQGRCIKKSFDDESEAEAKMVADAERKAELKKVNKVSGCEAARMLGVPIHYIRKDRLLPEPKIPFSRSGRLTMYDIDIINGLKPRIKELLGIGEDKNAV